LGKVSVGRILTRLARLRRCSTRLRFGTSVCGCSPLHCQQTCDNQTQKKQPNPQANQPNAPRPRPTSPKSTKVLQYAIERPEQHVGVSSPERQRRTNLQYIPIAAGSPDQHSGTPQVIYHTRGDILARQLHAQEEP